MDDKKNFHLVRYFAIAAVPLILLCVVIASVTHRMSMMENLKSLGEGVNVTLGQTLSNTFAEQINSIQNFLLITEIKGVQYNWMIKDLLDRPVSDFFQNTSIVRINIHTPTGELAYTSNNLKTFNTEPLKSEIITMIAQNPIYSNMKMNEYFTLNDGNKKNLMIVNTYMPIHDAKTGITIGTLSLFNDVSKAYEEALNGLSIFTMVIFILGLCLFYTMIFFMRKAEIIIEKKHEAEQRDNEFLKIAFNKATESTKAKNQFLASMGHELRTPLNAIIGYSEIQLDELKPADNSNLKLDLEHIRSAGQHLKSLIEGILDHAKIESGTIEINASDFILSDAIDSCISYIALDITKRNNTIQLVHDVDIKEINTDEVKIKRIILDLLNNANKFTCKGKITVDTNLDNGNIIIRISDTGIGISEHNIENIFEPFTQADNSFTRTHGGTGLGLTISREYARALEGDLKIIKHEGIGTIMQFSFPHRIPQSQHNNNFPSSIVKA